VTLYHPKSIENPRTERRHQMLRRGWPILRTAAIVGTARAVSGSVAHRQQQRYATRGRRRDASGHR
jgi:hypothetical protein